MKQDISPKDAARRSVLVASGDVVIDVTDEGTGPLVVLVPSSARGVEDFDEVAGCLALRGYRVLRPQPRGAGQSRGATDTLSLRDLAADVAAVIEWAKQGRAVVVGHAFGNWVARMVATRHPELVRGVVIAAAGSRHFPRELVSSLRLAGDVDAAPDARLAALRTAFFAEGNDERAWLDGWYPEIARYQAPIIADPREDEWWSGGVGPILDLQAAQDPFRPASSRNEIRDEFGDRIDVAVVDGASHALFPEQPDAVIAAVSAWIGRLPA